MPQRHTEVQMTRAAMPHPCLTHPRGSLVLALALWAVGCTTELDAPADARFSCTSDRDCPLQRTCNALLGVCVKKGGDTTPPRLEAVTLNRTTFGDAQTLLVTLQVSEPLAVAPEVRLLWGGASGAEVAASVVPGASTLSWTATYTFARATDPEGLATLAVTVVDSAGNPTHEERARALETDFTPPALFPGSASVRYADASAKIFVLGRARAGTTVTVSFTVTEPLTEGEEPAVEAGPGGEVVFSLLASVGQSYSFIAEVDAPPVDGEHPIQATVRDRALNQAILNVATLEVDTTPPSPPATDSPDLITFERAPWGRVADDASPSYRVAGGAGAVEAGATAIAYSSFAASGELGRAQADATGVFTAVLAPVDWPTVYLQAVDTAGNESTLAQVRDVVWHTSLRGKQVGQSFGNPHELTRVRPAALLTNGTALMTLTQSDYDALARVDGTLAGSVSATGYGGWSPRRPTPLALRRGFSPIAHDGTTGIGVLFGGYTPAGFTADTWQWDGATWRELAVDLVSPAPRMAHGLVVDPRRGVVVLFGGTNLAETYGDLWEWNGTQWVEISAPPGPPARTFHGAAFDPISERVLVFGGCLDVTCAPLLQDTWLWDGTSWTEAPAAGAPPPRSFPALATDPGRGVFLAGGCLEVGSGDPSQCDTPDNDLWLWDGSAWHTQPATGPEPQSRLGHSLVYDPLNDRLVLFGGRAARATNCAGGARPECLDAWSWRAGEWTDLAITQPIVPGRIGAACFFEPFTGAVAALGGMGSSDFYADLWVLGASGFEVAIAPLVDEHGDPLTIPAREGPTMVFDPTEQQSLMYGGLSDLYDCEGSESAYCLYVWGWDGARWSPIDPEASPSAPEPRAGHQAVYAAVPGAMLLFGGETKFSDLNDTWLLADGLWTQTCTSGCTPPSARIDHALAYEAARSRVILFGGDLGSGYSDGTYAWSLTQGWQKLCGEGGASCDGPVSRRKAAMTYDTLRQRVVLFGGERAGNADCLLDQPDLAQSNTCDDTWEWYDNGWHQVCGTGTTCTGPQRRSGAGLAYDTKRGRVVLFGGEPDSYDSARLADVWEWDGQTWQERTPVDRRPAPRSVAGMTYDPRRERIVLFGGDSGQQPEGDLWELDTSPNADVALAGRLVLATGLSDAAITQLDLRVWAGASGSTVDLAPSPDADFIGDAVPGVRLELWDTKTTAWQEFASGSADPGAPALLRYVSAQAVEGQRLVVRSTRSVHFRLRPLAGQGNGASAPTVAVDALELSLRYRLEP